MTSETRETEGDDGELRRRGARLGRLREMMGNSEGTMEETIEETQETRSEMVRERDKPLRWRSLPNASYIYESGG